MTTESGKRLLSIGGEFRWPRPDYAIAEAIAAIEAEAIAAERTRIMTAMAAIRDDPSLDGAMGLGWRAIEQIIEGPES